MMFYVMIVLAVGAASGLNTQCNNPESSSCQDGAGKGTRYFRVGSQCTLSSACSDQGYPTQEQCEAACFVGEGGQDNELDESCNGAKPTTVNCNNPEHVFFYDPESRTCKEITGCSPSSNSYDSEVECQVACGVLA
uniref:Putative chain r serine proteinase n=1 Tax=Ornithodoros turicata TaxID=34597 RepID=A0A2R5LEW7_9ACAR